MKMMKNIKKIKMMVVKVSGEKKTKQIKYIGEDSTKTKYIFICICKMKIKWRNSV